MLNVEMPNEDGTPFVCEVQVTLSGITILKKSLDFYRVLSSYDSYYFFRLLFLGEQT